MIALAFASVVAAASVASVALLPPGDRVGVDAAALMQSAKDTAGVVAGGPVVTVTLPTGPCDLRCRLDAAKATGAPLALLLDSGTLADATQVGVVLVELGAGRAIAQHAERVAPAGAAAAVARGVRAVFGKPAPDDDAAATAAAAAQATGGVRVVVAPPRLSSALGLDAAASSTIATRAAAIVQREPGFSVVTNDEVAAVLHNDRDQADLGAGDSTVFARAAAALDARLLLLVDVGVFGDAALVTGRLVDVQLGETETQRAEIVVDDLAQIPIGVSAVVLRLFGRTAPVPAPRAAASRFEAAVKRVARGLTPAFLGENGKNVLVLPFEQRGAVPEQMNVGPSAAILVWRTLSEGLPGPIWLPVPETSAADAVAQGRLAAAAVVITGTVSDVGTDLMLDASAIDVADGSIRARQTVLFPKGDQTTLIPLDKLVLKTRGEAMFRALVPGGGQFFNGPQHTWKGVAVAAGTGLGVVAGGVLFGAAALTQSATTEVGPGTPFYDQNRCEVNPLASLCAERTKELNEQATSLSWAGAAALGAGLVIYGLGVVDAGFNAE